MYRTIFSGRAINELLRAGASRKDFDGLVKKIGAQRRNYTEDEHIDDFGGISYKDVQLHAMRNHAAKMLVIMTESESKKLDSRVDTLAKNGTIQIVPR